jgi:hypothetical protein
LLGPAQPYIRRVGLCRADLRRGGCESPSLLHASCASPAFTFLSRKVFVAQPRLSAEPSSCLMSTNFLAISHAAACLNRNRRATDSKGETQLILDVDSDQLNDFDAGDQKYLGAIVELIRKQHFAITTQKQAMELGLARADTRPAPC